MERNSDARKNGGRSERTNGRARRTAVWYCLPLSPSLVESTPPPAPLPPSLLQAGLWALESDHESEETHTASKNAQRGGEERRCEAFPPPRADRRCVETNRISEQAGGGRERQRPTTTPTHTPLPPLPIQSPTLPLSTTTTTADRMMGRERNKTREGELKLRQSVGGVSCWAGMRVLPQTRPVRLASCCHQSMGLFGFSTSPHPHGSGQRSSPRHTPPAARKERENEGEQQQAGARNFPHLHHLFLAFYFHDPLLSSPSSVLSPLLLRLSLLGFLASLPPLRSFTCGGLR